MSSRVPIGHGVRENRSVRERTLEILGSPRCVGDHIFLGPPPGVSFAPASPNMPVPPSVRVLRGTAAFVVLASLLPACRSEAGTPDTTPASADSVAAPVETRFTVIGQVGVRELDESSGLVASRAEPGLFWTMNDDTDALVFALTDSGGEAGRVRLVGARNVDWESMSIGPCDDKTCLYVGDTGDNEGKRPTRTLYRLEEPTRTDGRFPESVRPQELTFRYADGPKDVEAMYVSRDGAVWLISKRPLRDASGRHRPALVYRIAPAAWSDREPATVAELVDSLPVIPGSAPARLITDASLSPDGATLAVRTYGELYLFSTDDTGRPRGPARRVCDLSAVGERQGEGIAWAAAAGEFLLSSEGSDTPRTRSTLARVECAP